MVKTPSLLETLCKDMSCHKANSSTCNDEELQRFESFGELTHVKRQAGYRRDPGNPTQDPKWEWQDPTIGGQGSHLSHLDPAFNVGFLHSSWDLRWDFCIPPGSLGGTYAFYPGS